MAPAATPKKTSARYVAARAIAEAAKDFPDIDAQSINIDALDHREARLALAIHRTVLQRWLTIEYLLNGYLRKPLRTMEPALQGILLTAGAQLLFMDRLPAHAVVDESVKLARAQVREGASGLVNAVLRRISELPDSAVRGKAWWPARDRLPLEDGFVPLRDACLPAFAPAALKENAPDHAMHELEKHLSVAASQPVQLVRRWIKDHGARGAVAMCAHGVRTPPVVVAVEAGFDASREELEALGERSAGGDSDLNTPLYAQHEEAGFVVWQGSHAQLTQFLRRHPARRVQDVTSSKAVGEAHRLLGEQAATTRLIVDYCAGRGTKTRQLASLFPESAIVATDTDDDRRGVLHGSFSGIDRVRVVQMKAVAETVGGWVAGPRAGGADLLLLDVPCTNTGVLARRPEARYRFNEATLKSLVRLQRTIVEQSISLLRPGGMLVYSTCSTDAMENQEQTAWIVQQFGCELLHETVTLPHGTGAAYRDGGYAAMLRKAYAVPSV
jgi:16S rRNA (cytosine967-C5)-methyltransferase